MALTEERRAALLAYCRIDDPSEEDLLVLEMLWDSAVDYLADAGVAEPEAGSSRRAKYDLCACAMVLQGYDLREAAVSGTLQDNPVFRRLLTQLKLSEPVSGPDTVGEG